MKRSDFHVHPGLVSRCAQPEATVQAYLDLCAKEGVTSIGFSDHLWDTDVSISRIYEHNSFDKLKEIYATIPQNRNGVKLFVGCETDINAYGEIGISKAHASELDYVLIPISHYHNKEVQFLGIDINDEQFMRTYAVRRFMRACEADFSVPTIICHPFIPHGTERMDEMMQAISDNDYLACFQCAAERNILIEIHYTACSNHWKHCENGFPVEYIRMATLAKEAGCKFTFGSDSHSPNKFGSGIHEGMERFAKYCGISESSIVHELPCNNKNFPR